VCVAILAVEQRLLMLQFVEEVVHSRKVFPKSTVNTFGCVAL
jgi:hypothetical protein